jgi:hypothetical protein
LHTTKSGTTPGPPGSGTTDLLTHHGAALSADSPV